MSNSFNVTANFNTQAMMRYGAPTPAAQASSITASTMSASIQAARGGFSAVSSNFSYQNANQFNVQYQGGGAAGMDGVGGYAQAYYGSASATAYAANAWAGRTESLSANFGASITGAASSGFISTQQAGYLAGLSANIRGMTGAFAGTPIDASLRFGFQGSAFASASYMNQLSMGAGFRMEGSSFSSNVQYNQNYGGMMAAFGQQNYFGGLNVGINFYGGADPRVGMLQNQLGMQGAALGQFAGQLGALQGNVGALAGGLGALGGQVAGLGGQVAGLTSDVGSLKSQFAGLGSTVGDLASKVATNQANTQMGLSTLDSKLGSYQALNDTRNAKNEQTIADLSSQLKMLQDKLAGLEKKQGADIGAVNTRIDGLDAKVDSSVTALNDRITAVDAKLGAEIKGLDAKFSGEISKLKAVDADMAAKFEGLQAKVTAQGEQLTKQLEMINNQAQSIKDMKADLQTQINSLGADQKDLRAKLEAESARLDQAQNDIGGLQSGLEAAKNEYRTGLSNLGNELAAANQKIDSVNGKVDQVRSELNQKIDAQGQALQGQLNGLNARVGNNEAAIAETNRKLNNTVAQMNQYLALHPDESRNTSVSVQQGWKANWCYGIFGGQYRKATVVTRMETDIKSVYQIDPNAPSLRKDTNTTTTIDTTRTNEYYLFGGHLWGFWNGGLYAVNQQHTHNVVSGSTSQYV